MAFYRVCLQGTGIRVPDLDGGNSITGFYATRAIRAGSAEEAVDRAKALVDVDWVSGTYKQSNTGQRPILTVEDVFSDHLLGYLIFRNKGYTFYTDSDES